MYVLYLYIDGLGISYENIANIVAFFLKEMNTKNKQHIHLNKFHISIQIVCIEWYDDIECEKKEIA